MTISLDVWNGSSWNKANAYVWDGIAWRSVNVLVSTGTAWQLVSPQLTNNFVITSATQNSGDYTESGYDALVALGSISTNQLAFFPGAPIINLAFTRFQNVSITGYSSTTLTFTMNGNVPNSGWNTLNIGIKAYNRSNASYQYSNGQTSWSWGGGGNPFPATGSTVSCSIT